MVNHIGMNINSGHYTATVRKDSKSDDWIHYDDDKITKSILEGMAGEQKREQA